MIWFGNRSPGYAGKHYFTHHAASLAPLSGYKINLSAVLHGKIFSLFEQGDSSLLTEYFDSHHPYHNVTDRDCTPATSHC